MHKDLKILITDTHFGCRNGSLIWLGSQLDFIYNQLIPYIKGLPSAPDLIHLGDVFDVRSSVNTLIAHNVRKVFEDLAAVCKRIIIVAGNHDFYSPTTDEYTSLNVVLRDIPGVLIVDKEPLIEDEDAYLPWYITETQNIEELSGEYKRTFCHTDITRPGLVLKNPVYSGHIHAPLIKGNLNNLGSCYALTFADTTDRGFYVLDNEDLTFILNTQSIRFWRMSDKDFHLYREHISKKDYIEITGTPNKADLEGYPNLRVVPEVASTLTKEADGAPESIEEILDGMIPGDLKDFHAAILKEMGVA